MTKFFTARLITEVFSPIVLADILVITVAIATDPTWLAPAGWALLLLVAVPLYFAFENYLPRVEKVGQDGARQAPAKDILTRVRSRELFC